MRKTRTVDKTGKVVVTKSEERFPYAADILMKYGFGIIFLNMALGLLPITIWGTRLKYIKCSISQLYTILFCFCFIILSVIFVPVVFFPKPEQQRSISNIVILVLMGITHVVGYIVLMLRGNFVARKMPIIWEQLCKIVQISVIDVYGKHCHLFKEVKVFSVWAVLEFIMITSFTMGSFLIFSEQYSVGLEDSFVYYRLFYIFNPLTKTGYTEFQEGTYRVSYFLWQLCSYGHVLVSMLLCYIVIMITVCLKSANLQIFEFNQCHGGKGTDIGTNIPKIRFINTEERRVCTMTNQESDTIIQKLLLIKKIMIIIEDLLKTISRVWGVSLVVEALILIASGTSATYNFFATFQQTGKNSTNANATINFDDEYAAKFVSFTLPHVDQWIQVLVTLSIHFFFLFKLACEVNKMIFEANKSMQILKKATFHHLPESIQQKVQDLKQDLASANIFLTASNYFQINKYLITSITSQIATYVIVLLQFAQQEINSKDSNVSQGNS